MLARGTDLTPADQRHVLGAYVHRFTADHVPGWARRPQPNGKFCNVQFASDHDWLAHSKFEVRKDGRLDQRKNSCESSPTWPNGKGWLDAPYGSPRQGGGGAKSAGRDGRATVRRAAGGGGAGSGSGSLTCDMVKGCKGPVAYVDNKGFIYCTVHGLDRKAHCSCRKLRPGELKKLQQGEPIGY